MTAQFLLLMGLLGIQLKELKEYRQDNYICFDLKLNKSQLQKLNDGLYSDNEDVRSALSLSLSSITSKDNETYNLKFRFKNWID